MFLTVIFMLHKPSTTKRNAMKAAMRLVTRARAAPIPLKHLYEPTPNLTMPQLKREVAAVMALLAKDKASYGIHGATINNALRDSNHRDVQACV